MRCEILPIGETFTISSGILGETTPVVGGSAAFRAFIRDGLIPQVRELDQDAPPGLHWHYETMPEEEHSTIYHPAALRAFRTVFKPATGR